jgi:hypothetical protein
MFDNYYSTIIVAKDKVHEYEKLADKLTQINEAKLAKKQAKAFKLDKPQPKKRTLRNIFS